MEFGFAGAVAIAISRRNEFGVKRPDGSDEGSLIEGTGAAVTSGFEQLLEQVITSSIRDLLGESPMRAIVYQLNMQSMARDPEVFDERLRKLLDSPASVIEEVIVKELFKRVGVVRSPRGPFDFQKYVSFAKSSYVSKES